MESRRSIFGSLKQTLSRNKQTAASNSTPQESHPQAKSVSTPTRRPGMHRCSSHCGEQSLTRHSAAPSSNPFHSASSFDAPPAYSPAPNSATAASPVRDNTATNTAPVADDAYAFLDEFDTIFLIDDSGSMAGGLWRQTADALMTITPICTAHDKDGVDIHFLNHPEMPAHKNVTSSSAVREIFQTVKPGGATPIGKKLQKIFEGYFEEYQLRPRTTKPINIICITDGVPTDDVEGELIQAAKKLDKLEAPACQVGVQFFQVGSDPEATRYLKELDDDLADIANDKYMRDIVDTVPFLGQSGTALSGAGILKVVLGAVMRRLDRKSKELHR
jgi:uncharacterized protein YegL